ncbi:probable prefoldin subunit 5 [Phlebotomus argentipes]|uniref:probable prefoldin subunit 5 n=1 Tax=Phlebotomus argentipes TaxID=94469 RepID=UPI0028933A75|nr:probable prefoldin subunit 5 [Phlebotomus argentipes]
MASISSTEEPGMQQIDLMKLNLQQLTQLKSQLDQELGVFQESLQTLKMAKSKFMGSKESLEQFKPEWKEKEQPVLVPLTGSMYVPGVIKQVDNVIIDVGTGYYAEKDVVGAKDYFKRKVDFVQEQVEKIEMLGFEKSKIRDAIMDVMEIKLAQLQKPA